MNPQNKAIGEAGSHYYDSSAPLTMDFYMIICQEDTVFSVLTEQDTGEAEASVLGTGQANQNVSGKTLKQGAVLTPAKKKFNTAAVSSGSFIGYKE